KARLDKDKYCTIRVRCYAPTQTPGRNYPEGIYALSAKTEAGKFRVPIPESEADLLFTPGMAIDVLSDRLPADLLARLYDLSAGETLSPAVTVCFTRYAVESTTDRLTLDCNITTSNGKLFP